MTTKRDEPLKTKTRLGDVWKDQYEELEEKYNPKIQVSAKITLKEKTRLYILIQSKGCDGLTSFLKMLCCAKEVEIKL